MRMSYSVIKDPCLSEDDLQHIDKIITFFNSQPKENQVNLTDKYDDNQHYVEKIGRSLLSKFPQVTISINTKQLQIMFHIASYRSFICTRIENL